MFFFLFQNLHLGGKIWEKSKQSKNINLCIIQLLQSISETVSTISVIRWIKTRALRELN